MRTEGYLRFSCLPKLIGTHSQHYLVYQAANTEVCLVITPHWHYSGFWMENSRRHRLRRYSRSRRGVPMGTFSSVIEL